MFIALSAFSGPQGKDKNKGKDNGQTFNINIKQVRQSIVIDGKLDDLSWQNTEFASRFINKWPLDTGWADAQTRVKIMYDDNFLYVAAICYQNDEDLIIQTLRRDNKQGFWSSDGFSVVLDPINQKSNGFLFGVNAGGAQMESALTIRGTQTEMDENWDNKWYSAVTRHKDHWIAELAIPFKTLRYNDQNRRWGVNFLRNDMKRNVFSTWAQVPLNFRGIDLGHTGTMSWDAPPKKTKANIAVIPFTAGGITKDHEENEPTKADLDVGFDAKIALTSSLNLDLTVNPDFSNVDVDQQVTNVSRFSVFFPERRGFFLENSDLFTGYGTWGVRPFFSRRIGLEDGEAVPIAFGARITGNITDDMRIGIMDVHTRQTDELDATNFFITSIQKRVLKRSSIKFLFNNKQAFGVPEDQVKEYNRTGGVEFEYTSNSGGFSSSFKAHTSRTEENFENNSFLALNARYNGLNFYSGFNYNRVDENYIVEMGFVPRLNHYDAVLDTTIRIGYQSINPWIGYKWYGGSGSTFRQQEISTWTVWNLTSGGRFMERRTSVNYERTFNNNNNMRLEIFDTKARLFVPADLIDSDVPLPVGDYRFTMFRSRFRTDRRKMISTATEVNVGQFFNGSRLEISNELNIRKQPWGTFGIAYRVNRIKLAEGYGENTLHLIGPKAEIAFSNTMAWTTFMQYNTQDENFNINSRFQWRYKPMSDFFIVYTDNYATSDFSTKNRGIVFKLTYWFNI